MTMPCHITDGPQYHYPEMSVREEMERDKLLSRIRQLLVDDLVEYRHLGWLEYGDYQVEWEKYVLASIARYQLGTLTQDEMRQDIIARTQRVAKDIVWPLTAEMSNADLERLEEQDERDKFLKGRLT